MAEWALGNNWLSADDMNDALALQRREHEPGPAPAHSTSRCVLADHMLQCHIMLTSVRQAIVLFHDDFVYLVERNSRNTEAAEPSWRDAFFTLLARGLVVASALCHQLCADA
eukprot:6499264-Prymnesium_polylepis.2